MRINLFKALFLAFLFLLALDAVKFVNPNLVLANGEYLLISARTDKDVYQLSETMVIEANVTYSDGTPANLAEAYADLYTDTGIFITRVDLFHVDGPTWIGAYVISEYDPPGTWTVNVTAVDVTSLENFTTITVVVEAPTSLIVVSYTDKTTYEKLDVIHVFASVHYPNNTLVEQGDVFAVFLMPGEVNETVEMEYNETSMRWECEYQTNYSVPSGMWTIVVNATSGSYSGSDTVEVEVKPAQLAVDLRTDKDSYKQNETVKINATITYPNGYLYPEVCVNVSIYCEDIFVSNATLAFDEELQAWVGEYWINFTDPIGIWDLELYVEDEYGNYGSNRTSITVEAAPLLVVVTTDKKVYQKLETINIYANISFANGSLVTGGEALVEIYVEEQLYDTVYMAYNAASSRWQASYSLTMESPTGVWHILVKASYANLSGVGECYVKVVPIKLSISAEVAPSYRRGDTLAISAMVSYPDGSPLVEGSVTAYLYWIRGAGQQQLEAVIELSYEDGFWKGSYLITYSDDVGSWNVTIVAEDEHGNYGSFSTTTSVEKAELKVYAFSDKVTYTIGETIVVYAMIEYPDGSPLTDAEKSYVICRIGGIAVANCTYDPTRKIWSATFEATSGLSPGVLLVEVKAMDKYYNEGSYTFSVNLVKRVTAGIEPSLALLAMFTALVTVALVRKLGER